jgi:hypothetical protein
LARSADPERTSCLFDREIAGPLCPGAHACFCRH